MLIKSRQCHFLIVLSICNDYDTANCLTMSCQTSLLCSESLSRVKSLLGTCPCPDWLPGDCGCAKEVLLLYTWPDTWLPWHGPGREERRVSVWYPGLRWPDINIAMSIHNYGMNLLWKQFNARRKHRGVVNLFLFWHCPSKFLYIKLWTKFIAPTVDLQYKSISCFHSLAISLNSYESLSYKT